MITYRKKMYILIKLYIHYFVHLLLLITYKLDYAFSASTIHFPSQHFEFGIPGHGSPSGINLSSTRQQLHPSTGWVEIQLAYLFPPGLSQVLLLQVSGSNTKKPSSRFLLSSVQQSLESKSTSTTASPC